MKATMSKTLYQKTSKGEIQVWEIRTEGSQIITTYGLKDGKMQTATKTAKGKNVGRANETTPEEQAVLEAESMYKKKMDKGYFPTEEEAQNNLVLLPMLAVDWFKHSKKYTEDDRFAVQPKLDGCLHEDSIVILETLGKKTIKDVVENRYDDRILSYNTKTGKTQYSKIKNFMKNISDISEECNDWYEIVTEDNKVIKITGNHRVWMPKLKCWRRVDELSEHDYFLIL